MKKMGKILIVSLITIETICVIVFGILSIKRGNEVITLKIQKYDVPDPVTGEGFYSAFPTIIEEQWKPNELLWIVYPLIIGTVLGNLGLIYIIISENINIIGIILLALCVAFFISTFFIPVIEVKEKSEYGYRYIYMNIYNMKISSIE